MDITDNKNSILSDEFVANARKLNHDVHIYKYMNGDSLCTTIYADFTDHILKITNHCEFFFHTAFGNNFSPTWDDLMEFFEERCVSRNRAYINEYLNSIGLFSYDPIEIIKKTQGRMAEDNHWIYEE